MRLKHKILIEIFVFPFTHWQSVETQAKFKQHIVQKYMILDELDGKWS